MDASAFDGIIMLITGVVAVTGLDRLRVWRLRRLHPRLLPREVNLALENFDPGEHFGSLSAHVIALGGGFGYLVWRLCLREIANSVGLRPGTLLSLSLAILFGGLYPWALLREVAHAGRRRGLGTAGLAALACLVPTWIALWDLGDRSARSVAGWHGVAAAAAGTILATTAGLLEGAWLVRRLGDAVDRTNDRPTDSTR